jgi:hypothetical protein
MPASIALLFNLLALRSILNDDLGRGVRNVRIVIFPANAEEITNAELEELIARVEP